ncbi:ABC transporter permease [Kutzneria viridogrisea]|uniref:ABC transport system permease protein n=1 Tax=Kutzneria viridogrisea TaxID=47990 RepID=A0ABR6BF78_9PSEU|nr:putative ABC transport system permease protein [Kutzneria viridogrisea]
MLKTTLAGLRARTARLVLSSIAIVLGVAFVSGTLILGSALDANLHNDFARQTRGVDVSVEPGRSSSGSADEDRGGISQTQLDQVRAVPGVAAADARWGAQVPLVGANGKAKSATVSALEGDQRLRMTDLQEGRMPAKADEIALDATTAQTAKLAVGQKVSVLDQADKPVPLTIVGTYTQGVSKSSLSGDAAVLLPSALAPLAKEHYVGQVVVAADQGVSQQQLADRISTAVGGKLSVKTGEQYTVDVLKQISRGSGGLTQFMLVFALIALVVAAMVIYNTFTILVAQRTRELALLRCIGADRGQVFRSVLLEALVMGLFASVLGLGAGVGLSAALQAGVGSVFGGSKGPVQLPLTVNTVLIAFGVGVVVTVLSAVLPALRATRVAPLAALRSLPDSQDEVRRTSVVRMAFVAILALLGGGVCFIGLRSGDSVGFIVTGLGTMVLLGAVIALGPVIVGPVNRVLGALPRLLFGVPAKLASANATRNPKRTAATTAALMIGVTIVTMITVAAASGKESVTSEIDKQFPADYLVTSAVREHPLPTSLADQLRAQPEVQTVTPTGSAEVKVNGKSLYLFGTPADSLGKSVQLKQSQGDVSRLGPDTLLLSDSQATRYGLKVGDRVRAGGATLTLAGTYSNEDQSSAIVSLETLQRIAPGTGYRMIMIKARDGVSPQAGQAAVEKATASSPIAEVASGAARKSDLAGRVDQMLMIMWALVGLAVVIALFGIANTLTLSVLERTRESALLRALGLTRGQLGFMLLIESVLIGLMGAVIGVLLGIGFAKLVVSALSTDKLQVGFVLPAGQLAVMLAVAVLAAAVAAVLPARRAARTSVVAGMAEA